MNIARLTGAWRFSPLYESAEGIGAGAPEPVETTPAESGSLSDHEAHFSPDALAADPEPSADRIAEPQTSATERDETGKFKPRHRATSQRAGAEDVPRIATLTKNWRTAEAERDALKAERETLARERDELKARLDRPSAQTPEPSQAKTPATSQPSAAADFDFPEYEPWLEANPGKDWNVYRRAELRAFSDWKDQQANIDGRIRETLASERASHEFHAAREQTHAKGRASYADFDTVLSTGPGATVDLHADGAKASQRVAFIVQHPQSEHLQYAIMKDADLARRLASLDDIGFGLELATLVASSQRSPSSRSAAASTGSAPALVRPPAPRPPNPVRTGSIAEPDTPPDPDDQSLSAHEKHYGSRLRRA